METKEIMDAIGGLKSAFDATQQQNVTEIKKLSDAVTALEKKQNATPATNNAGMSDGMKEMIQVIQGLKTAVTPSTVGNNTSGGYLAIPDFQARVVEKMREAAPLLDVVDNIRIDGNTAYLPVEVSQPVANWTAEAAGPITASGAELTVKNIQLQSLRTKVAVSDELLADSNLVNIENYLVSACSKAQARAVSQAILYGRGATTYNEPSGIVTDSAFVTVETAASGAISATDIFDLIGAVPSTALPEARFVCSNATFMKLAKALGTSDVVQLPMAENIKPAIFGYPVTFADVHAVAAGETPLLFGNFKAGYKAVTSGGLTYKRDESSMADYGQVAVRFLSRVGGALVDENAIVGLKVKA